MTKTNTKRTVHVYAPPPSRDLTACGKMTPGDLVTLAQWGKRDAVTCDACLAALSPPLQRLGEYDTGPA